MVIPFSTHAGDLELETTFAGSEFDWAINEYISTFFDVEVTGSNDVLVDRVSINLMNEDTVHSFRVYTRSGTFRGHETSSGGWTLVTD